MRPVRLTICIALAIAAPGFAQAGDFGRPTPSLLNRLIPKSWTPVAGASGYPLTDLEEELRDRSYALIRPNEPSGTWKISIVGLFQIAHPWPGRADYDHTAYGRMLVSTHARSEASLYNRLIEDMGADASLIRPFVAVARAVADLDGKRHRSLAYVGELSEGDVADALGRIRENCMVSAWVQRALHGRLRSYRYALERLVISVPSPLAVEAERALKRLQAEVAAADTLLAQFAGDEFAVSFDPGGAIVTK